MKNDPKTTSAKQLPTFAQWLTDLVPVNPIKTAADGTMLTITHDVMIPVSKRKLKFAP